MNYFNYFTEIETRFQQRRGSLLMLSTLDWALIETWREAGVPLEAVLRGIDAAFDKHDAQSSAAPAARARSTASPGARRPFWKPSSSPKKPPSAPRSPPPPNPANPASRPARVSRYLQRNATLLTAAAPNLPVPASAAAAESSARLPSRRPSCHRSVAGRFSLEPRT